MSTHSGKGNRVTERTRTHTAQIARQGTVRGSRQGLRERGAEATRNLREAMRLPTNPGDTTILGMALAEVAAVEGRRNPQFASEVRRRYEELQGQQRQRQTREELPPLKPVRTDLPWRPIDPAAPPDPQFLIQVYGRHQLGRALQEYTVAILKRTAAVIERQNPGTKPANRGRKEPLIAYILEHS